MLSKLCKGTKRERAGKRLPRSRARGGEKTLKKAAVLEVVVPGEHDVQSTFLQRGLRQTPAFRLDNMAKMPRLGCKKAVNTSTLQGH